ncbi:MAG: hypothetical protein KBD10_02280 [Candidatus Pacebacteria bacterium]|jgi:large-conductance mechanosensitive channel|nr:hypothetical protein [Candidatus Paceibacterota bacterium]
MNTDKNVVDAEFEDVTNKKNNTIKNKITFGNVVTTIGIVLFLVIAAVVIVVVVKNNNDNIRELLAEKQEDPKVSELTLQIQRMQEAEKALMAENERKLAEASEKSRIERLETDRKIAEAVALVKTATAPAPVAVPTTVPTQDVEKLSADKTAELLFLGKPGQGYKEPGHSGGPLVFSLKQADIPGFGPVYLPNVNERRSVSGSAGEIIPAPQMRCPLPTGVTSLNWVQTPIADPAKAGNFLFALTPN